MGEFELLVGLTARLASTPRLDDIVEPVVHHIVELGFDAVWVAVLDEESGNLTTLKDVIDGVPSPRPFAATIALDTRQPLGRAFRERRMINVTDPACLHLVDRDADADAVPADRLALPRAVHTYLRGRPFACGPTLGSRGQPVGALVLSSYRTAQPIADAVLDHGLLRALIDHLGVAMERALHVARLERLDANLRRAQAAIARDARLKAVGELSAGVAHDLNNLCGMSMLAVSVGERSPAAAAGVMQRIALANLAIRDLVSSLQRAARPPAGESHDADLPRIIQDLVLMVKPALREHGVELDVELPALPAVRCDPVVVFQVVWNLVINARDALAAVPFDRRVITIRAHDDPGAVRLIISDSGPGIAPEVLEHLFTPYTTTKHDAHLGLGLAHSRTSLAQYGGTIDARNATSGGAVFEVALIAASTGRPVVAEDPAPVAVSTPGRARILAVDDDPDLLCFIGDYLASHGYEVSKAVSSTQAFEATAAEAFDLVLCDVGMPMHSGPEVCRLMRAAGYRGKLVLMTGWESESLIAQRDAPWDAVLKKPVMGGDLLKAIDAVLGRDRKPGD